MEILLWYGLAILVFLVIVVGGTMLAALFYSCCIHFGFWVIKKITGIRFW